MLNNDDHALSNLGEKLLLGVRNLWQAVNGHTADIEQLKERMKRLEGELHGLKVSRGKARARNQRLEGMLAEAEGKLTEVRRHLH